MAKTKTSKFTEKDAETLGRAMQTVIESGYTSHRRLYKVNFIRGLVFGFGSALGATFLVAALAWALTLFQTIPILGDLSEIVKDTIETNEPQ